jgi:hypothetical protein
MKYISLHITTNYSDGSIETFLSGECVGYICIYIYMLMYIQYTYIYKYIYTYTYIRSIEAVFSGGGVGPSKH